MSNIESYDGNLEMRLDELRRGDRAYDLHGTAITEAIVFSSILKNGPKKMHRTLDIGCGLGFLTKRLASDKGFEAALGGMEVIGIDSSEKAISLAQKEHSGVKFYHSSAEDFPNIMNDNSEESFDFALLNMVLHSADNEAVSKIISGTRKCLKPEGTIIIVVPGSRWLMKKLVDYAIDQGMEKDAGVHWVHEMCRKDQVDLPVKITKGDYYPKPLTIFNRTPEDYAKPLFDNGFGVIIEPEGIEPTVIPYWTPRDFTMNYELYKKERSVLVSFALENPSN